MQIDLNYFIVLHYHSFVRQRYEQNVMLDYIVKKELKIFSNEVICF